MCNAREAENGAGGYRYGFNGKENDNEVKGEGNQQDYGFRIYDPRLGRFLSVDPLINEYPELTPYQFAGNSPITFIDRDGAESTYKMPDGSLYVHPHSDHLRLPIPQYVQQNGEFISAGKGDLTGVSMTLDFIPVVGSLKGLIEGIAGEDLEGNKLSTRERIVGVVPYLGKVKKLTKVVKAADKINDVKTAQKTASKVDDVADASKKLADDASDPTKNRVKLRKDVKEKIKENQPRNDKDEMIDPNTKQVLKPGEIDTGHKPGNEWRKRKKMHEEKGSTREQVIEEENNPDLYQLEDRRSNRSHKHEKKD